MQETQLRNHRNSTTAATAPPPPTTTNINKNRSISDADSPISQADSFHSPRHSPFDSDKSTPKSPSMAIVAVNDDKYYSPLRSPPRLDNSRRKQRQDNLNFPPPPTPPAMNSKMILDRAVKEDITAGVKKVGPTGGSEGLGYDVEGVGGERRSRPAVASISRRSRKDETVERVALGLRVCEMILCLISFSVMAADKTEGWSGDSFDRYREYRYCLSMNVVSFLYSGLQACDLTYHLATGKHFISHHLRYHFDFVMDQILAYLLVSASSSAATRVDDWVSNWGKDQFTEMASASIGVSFVAFLAFALSSLISGYNLCNPVSSVL